MMNPLRLSLEALSGILQMAGEVLLDSGVERAAEIDGVFRREHDLGDELAVGGVGTHVRELQDDRVVRNGDLGGVTEGRRIVRRYGDGDLSLLFHKINVVYELIIIYVYA